jgi:hypothetical protein
MKLLNRPYHIDQLPPSPLRNHLTDKYNDLVETVDDPPPIFIIIEPKDNLAGPDFAFVSDNGLLGDGDTLGLYEAVTHLPDLNMYELLFLVNGEDGYWIYVSDTIVDANPDLTWVMTSDEQGGLPEPQPL